MNMNDLQRYETKIVRTQNPNQTITDERRLGWHLVSHAAGTKVIASSHEGGAMAIGGGASLYAGTSRYSTQEWYSLQFARDTSHPSYPKLMAALAEIPRDVPEPPSKPRVLGLMWMLVAGLPALFLVFFLLLLPFTLIPAVKSWSDDPGPVSWAIVLGIIALFGLLVIGGWILTRVEYPKNRARYEAQRAAVQVAWERAYAIGEAM